jgi:hypothetical protein
MCKHKFTRNKFKSIDNQWIFFYIKLRTTKEVTNAQDIRSTYRKGQGNQD